MNLQDYIDSNKLKKVPADIIERWQTRIVARGLHQQGEAGAQVYLRDYGKGIAAKKCLALAQQAMNEGCPEMARGFYMKAAQLEGVEISDAGNPNLPSPIATAINNVRTATVQAVDHPGFPPHFQPGKFAPMQPVDATSDRAYYIEHPGYWCQPKIDGVKLIVFATADHVFYQSRTMKLNGAPSIGVDNALRNTARELGNFILEGELTFLDCEGKEHRTGSQAATASAEKGVLQFIPQMRYVVFSCPWRAGSELCTYGDMIDEGYLVANRAGLHSSEIAAIVTARTPDEKVDLALKQRSEGREGEVWFLPSTTYRAGKHNDEHYVRTKYLTEFEALVTGFTATTAEGHAFGAMEISSLDGKPLGSVGTGFTRQDKRELMERFHNHGPFRVSIVSQGYTEAGIAWLPRYQGIVK